MVFLKRVFWRRPPDEELWRDAEAAVFARKVVEGGSNIFRKL
jgi:hypothetical protein